MPVEFYVHGILRGYNVSYRAVAVANETLKEKAEELIVTVGPMNRSVELDGLDAFTRYHIQVLAFTRIGDGVKSKVSIAGK